METLVILEENKECPWSNTNEYSWYTKHPVIERLGFTYSLDSVFRGSYVKSYSEVYGEERGYIPTPVIERINCIYKETNHMTFNQEEYIKLFSEIVIKPIESEEELDRYVKLVEPYFFDKEKTPEEVAIYELLCILIEKYENEHYPPPELEPLELLKGFMGLHDLKQKDLVGILGSKGVVSEVLNGKREITKAQAKKLGEHFGISYKDFL